MSHDTFYLLFWCVFLHAWLRLTLRYLPSIWSTSRRSVDYATRNWRSLPDFPSSDKEVLHAVVIPVYSEDEVVVDSTLSSLAATTAAQGQLAVFISVEAHSKRHQERADHWTSEWKNSFLHFAVTKHFLQCTGPELAGKGVIMTTPDHCCAYDETHVSVVLSCCICRLQRSPWLHVRCKILAGSRIRP